MERQQVYNSLEHRIVDFVEGELNLVSFTTFGNNDLELKLTYEYLATFFGGFYMWRYIRE